MPPPPTKLTYHSHHNQPHNTIWQLQPKQQEIPHKLSCQTIPTVQHGIWKYYLKPHSIHLWYTETWHHSPPRPLPQQWFKCSPTCDSLLFTEGSLSRHQKSVNTNTPSTKNQTQPQLSRSIIFGNCPPQFDPKLHALIDQNTNKNKTLYITVLRWNATTNTTNKWP